MLTKTIKGVPVQDFQADELWTLMAAGIARKPWSLADLLGAAMQAAA